MQKKLPNNPSIRHLKIQAKNILKAFHNGKLGQCASLRLIKRFAPLSDEELLQYPVKLNDAQYAVALIYGFKSWQNLSFHCKKNSKEMNMNEKTTEQFNALCGMENRSMQRLLRDVDTRILAKALKNADNNIRKKIMVNMSVRAGKLLVEDINLLGETNDNIIITARKKILDLYMKLIKSKDITSILNNHEEYTINKEPIQFLKKKRFKIINDVDIKKLFVQLSKKSIKMGLLQLEPNINRIDDELIKKGIELIVDGTEPNLTKEILESILNKRLNQLKVQYEASIKAISAIQAGDNPTIIKDRLDAILS